MKFPVSRQKMLTKIIIIITRKMPGKWVKYYRFKVRMGVCWEQTRSLPLYNEPVQQNLMTLQAKDWKTELIETILDEAP